MKRIDAIRNIMNTVTDEIVISSCGRISREVFYINDRNRNFYVQGSMGSCLPVAIGIALCKQKEKIIVIVGDGEILMNLGTLVLLNNLQERYELENLKLFILDNNCYQSTGAQPTISHSVDFRLLCDCKTVFCGPDEDDVPRITISHSEIKERFMNAIQ